MSQVISCRSFSPSPAFYGCCIELVSCKSATGCPEAFCLKKGLHCVDDFWGFAYCRLLENIELLAMLLILFDAQIWLSCVCNSSPNSMEVIGTCDAQSVAWSLFRFGQITLHLGCAILKLTCPRRAMVSVFILIIASISSGLFSEWAFNSIYTSFWRWYYQL